MEKIELQELFLTDELPCGLQKWIESYHEIKKNKNANFVHLVKESI